MKQLTSTFILLVSITSFAQSPTYTSVQACFSYTTPGGTVASVPGQYIDTIPAVNVGDSIVITMVDLLYPFGSDLEFENGTLESKSAYLIKWMDCQTMQLIPNAEGSTFTPNQNGSYAALLYEHELLPACTTNCFVLQNLNTSLEIENEPFLLLGNPTYGEVRLKFNSIISKTIEMYDQQERLVFKVRSNTISQTVNIKDKEPGIYYLVIVYEDGTTYKRKIVKNAL